MKKALLLPSGQLALKVRIISMDDGSIGLYLDEANPEIVQAFQRLGTPKPIGKDMETLSTGDQKAFGEWSEYIIRCRFMSYALPLLGEDDHTVSCHLLQHWHFLGDWYVVQLICSKYDDIAMAVFHKPDQFPHRTMLSQLVKKRDVDTSAAHKNIGGHWIVDCLGHTTLLSRKLAKILELGDKDVLIPTQRYLDTIHPKDRLQVIETLDHIGDMIVSFESRSLTPNQKIIHLNTFATPMYDEKGRLTRIFGFSEVAAESGPLKGDLALSRERFLNIVEYSGDLYFVVGKNRELIYLSPTTAKIIGIDPLEYQGKSLDALAKDRTGWSDALGTICNTIDEKKSGSIKYAARSLDGRERWYHASIFSALARRGEDSISLIIGHDITREMHRERQLQYLSAHDGLTATYNRFEFWRLLEEVHRRHQQPYCLVIMDINGLKLINHVYGQLKGDQVLVDVADAIQQEFPQNRYVARISGDEFAVIVYDTPPEQVVKYCEAINRFCSSTNNRMLPISVAWGMACRDEVAGGPQSLFQVAESRMYDNKMIQKNSMHSQVVYSLKEALKARNVETADHMERMEKMVSALGSRLGLATHDYNRLLLLASLHDVGKLGIPDDIINKPGPLTEEEWDVMRSHTEIGHRIVLASPELSGIGLETLSHHENWDGSGYPNGKREDEIPLLAQIISVVDAYDVMTHRRVYKEPISKQAAIEELKRCRATQFSPVVTDLFIEIISQPYLE